MSVKMHESWKSALADELEKTYFKQLTAEVRVDYLLNEPPIYPPTPLIFNAFALTPFSNVKVVILGQDPYHGPGQAMGLSFSVPSDQKIPPSLQNIYKEIQNDLGTTIPKDGNLERWAKQGALLLNATLTVKQKSPGSHQGRGWEQFTDTVIKMISDQKEHVVFLLWGKYAQAKSDLIDETKHLVLKASHPSPFSAHTSFFGCKHFSKTNEYLTKYSKDPIQW